jgi:hypothetical protein
MQFGKDYNDKMKIVVTYPELLFSVGGAPGIAMKKK